MPFIWVCTSAYFNNWVICSAFCGRSPMLYYITYHVRQSLHYFDTVTLSSNQLICVSIRLISTAVAENLILYYSLPFYSWSPLYFTIWIGCTFCCYHYVIHTGSFYYSSQYCCLFSLIQVSFFSRFVVSQYSCSTYNLQNWLYRFTKWSINNWRHPLPMHAVVDDVITDQWRHQWDV